MMAELRDRLLVEIGSRLPQSARTVSASPPTLTVGVEHELFLLNSGNPCNHSDSQSIFSEFVKQGWSQHVDPCSNLIYGVSAEMGGGGLAWVKYEYDPHLLEISTPYFVHTADLGCCLSQIWLNLLAAAARHGLTVASIPVWTSVNRQELPARTLLSNTKTLQAFRESLVKLNGGSLEYAGFPAWTAATQTHIGGIPWFGQPSIVNALYSRETELSAGAFRQASRNKNGGTSNSDLWSEKSLFAQRWEGYNAVYGTTPLLGFPDFINGWTLESWADALLVAPIAALSSHMPTFCTVAELGQPPNDNWELFLSQVRDLQLVRPRISGTLEFRGDPAQPSVAAIVELAEARLLACRECLVGDDRSQAFRDARLRWLKGKWAE